MDTTLTFLDGGVAQIKDSWSLCVQMIHIVCYLADHIQTDGMEGANVVALREQLARIQLPRSIFEANIILLPRLQAPKVAG